MKIELKLINSKESKLVEVLDVRVPDGAEFDEVCNALALHRDPVERFNFIFTNNNDDFFDGDSEAEKYTCNYDCGGVEMTGLVPIIEVKDELEAGTFYQILFERKYIGGEFSVPCVALSSSKLLVLSNIKIYIDYIGYMGLEFDDEVDESIDSFKELIKK